MLRFTIDNIKEITSPSYHHSYLYSINGTNIEMFVDKFEGILKPYYQVQIFKGMEMIYNLTAENFRTMRKLLNICVI